MPVNDHSSLELIKSIIIAEHAIVTLYSESQGKENTYKFHKGAAILRSIRTKLTVLVLATVVSSVLLVSAVFAWIDLDHRFQAKRHELQGIAAAFATSVAYPLANRELDNVARTLSAVGRIPGLTYARVSDGEGRPVHQFGFGVVVTNQIGAVEANPDIGPFTALYLATYPVAAPIISGGNRIGQVTLIADLSSLRGAVADSILSALIAATMAATFGLLLSRRLQRGIMRPISKLTYAMQDVARTKDFDRQVEKTSRDEISQLVDAFNTMLTEVRTRDVALGRHRDHLETTVTERTAELASAKRVAEDASAAKSEFLATMSHEVRTPLNGMLVVAELMATATLTPRVKRYADVLLTSGQTLLAIINDILDFSKIEAGKLQLEALPVRPQRLVDDVAQLFSARAVAKGLQLIAEVQPDVPEMVVTDPVRLTQILSNLVGNAIKFTETGGVGINVRFAAASVTAPQALLVEVLDTGIGIPADKLTAVFDAFSQADQSTTRRFGGTGFGLTICKRLANAMGGEIQVKSEAGQGSTFSVRIPVEAADAATIAAIAAQEQAASASTDNLRTFSGIRVLAADDNAVNREVLGEALSRLGAEVVCVEDGRAAVAAIQAGTFDLVLMDCSMPVMDGYAATRAIRAWERQSGREQLPVVALTAHVIGEQANVWREAGMTGYLTKPYTLKSLGACLTEALGPRSADDNAATAAMAEVDSSPTIKSLDLLLDTEVLHSIAEMQSPGDDLVGRVVKLYATHAPRAFETLLTVMDSANPIAIAEAAHALRSLSRNIGAVRVGDLCTQLEAQARDGDLSRVSDQCQEIQLALPATIAALTAQLVRHAGKPELRQLAG